MERSSILRSQCASLALAVALRMCAQGEDDHWFFGQVSSVDFTSGEPVAGAGPVTSMQGSACISDRHGGLLFFTDGTTVWNREQDVMPNGPGLLGGAYAEHPASIVPMPGQCGKYYVFTTTGTTGDHKLRWSVVDMALDSGKGDIVAVQKNQVLWDNVSDRMDATRHANGRDAWLVVHNGWSDEFYVFGITEQGIWSEPSVFALGTEIFFPLFPGTISISPDGGKILHCTGELQHLDLLDLDNTTGNISNVVDLSGIFNGTPWMCWGEFSPTGRFAYIQRQYQDYTRLDQLDLWTMVRTNIASASGLSGISALRLGRDGRIHVARVGEQTMGAVNNPDLAGTACGYSVSTPGVPGGFLGRGLPAHVVKLDIPVEVDLGGDTVVDCDFVPYPIELEPEYGAAYLWSDGTTGAGSWIPGPGTYWVSLTTPCGSTTDTIRVIEGLDIRFEQSDPLLPNVFSPNGDGMNELFPGIAEPLPGYSIVVWNRWGEVVQELETSDWNGEDQRTGQQCSAGCYFYTAQLRMKKGCGERKVEKRGTITLLR